MSDDDDLLSLDLDDDFNKNPVSQMKPPDSTDVFKKPVEIEKFLLEEREDEIISTFSNNKSISVQEQKELSQLFANDDEDEEDQFIASQSIFSSSTQVVTKPESPPPIIAENSRHSPINSIEGSQKQQNPRFSRKPLETSILEDNGNKSIIPQDSQNSSRNVKNVKNVKNDAKSNDLAMLEMISNNKTWTYALTDMKKLFRSKGLESMLLQAYSLNFYYKKFFEYDLLMRPTEAAVRKLPLVCVWIKEITRKASSATVLLTDFTSDIKGSIMSSFLKNKDNFRYLMIGSVMLLKDVYLLQVNHNKNCYHLNINVNNIVTIYYPDLEELTSNYINKFDVQQFDSIKIQKLIDDFEKEYTNFEYKPPVGNDSTLNRTAASKKFNNTKSAPYQIPAHLNKSNQSRNQTNSSVKPNEINRNSKINTGPGKSNSSGQNISNVNKSRDFQFNKTAATSISTASALNKKSDQNFAYQATSQVNTSQINTTIGIDNQNDSNLYLAQHSTQNTQNALSEDIFSQLIFGIEDELLNDSG